jgi:hypothetical protein
MNPREIESKPDVAWTAKGPLLIVGTLLVGLAGLASVLGGRRAAILAIVLAVLGAGFVGYSLMIKEWCALKGTTYGATHWGQGFGGGLGDCLKAKGWFSF